MPDQTHQANVAAVEKIDAIVDNMRAERETVEQLAPGALKEAYRRWDELLNSDERVKAARSAGEDISELAEELRRQAFREAFDGATVRKPPRIPPSGDPSVHARMAVWVASMQTNRAAASTWIAGVMTGVAGKTGRAPREARNTRTRGSRRGARAAASSSDDPAPEPEPPSADLCAAGCGQQRRPQLDPPHRYYCSDECRREHARDRQRKTRGAKRDAQLAERPLHNTRAKRCDCGGEAAYAIDNGWVCVPCGRTIPDAPSDVNGHVADQDVLDVLRDEIRDKTTHVPWVHREWKVAKQNPEFWSWKEHGRELAGILVEKGTAEYEGQPIPTRTFHRLDHGDYRTVWLWESPKRLRELFADLDPQEGDFVYIRVDEKKPKRDKPGEPWTPVFMHVTPAAKVDQVAREAPPHAADEATETVLADERDDHDGMVDDHGTPITY